MVDWLLVTTIGANLATIVALIVSVYSLKKEVVKYANNFQNMQNSVISYINKVDVSSDQNVQINNSTLYGVDIRNEAVVPQK